MANNYNRIAPFYDSLKKIVFGKSLIRTECHFLKQVDKNCRMLVIGCGSSEFLENIDLDMFEQIVCLDKSDKMCHKSIQRAKSLGISHKIQVKNKDFLNLPVSDNYDILAMPYFLDCQSDEDIQIVLRRVHSLLEKNGSLIISDFNNSGFNSLFDKFLIQLMYLFFKISTRIPRYSLPDFDRFFKNSDWKVEKTHLSHSQLLFSKKLKNK